MVAGHWSPSVRQCSRCATHHAVTPFELLTLVLVHLPLLPFQSLWSWRGDDFCTVVSFVITDTLYLVWYCGAATGVHYRFLGAISESCVSVEDQCSCPYPYQTCAVWQVCKGATPHNIHNTPFMCLSTWIDTSILCAQVYAHTASRLYFFAHSCSRYTSQGR